MHRSDPLLPLGLALLLASLGGCVVPMTSSNTYTVPLANGENMEMSIDSKGLTLVNGGGLQVVQATLTPSADKKNVSFVFELAAKPGVVPKHIVVDNLSDDPPTVLAEDPAPKLVGGHWKLTTPILDPKAPGLEWITQLDDTIQVYRFTVELTDGTKVVLRQPAMYPAFEKTLIRKMLGLDK